MDDDLELRPPPLHPAHRRQISLLSGLMHAGLALVAVSAVWTVQPGMTPRQWGAYLLVALAMLIWAAVTRGRCGFQDGGKLVTALGGALVLRLARDPQLAAIPSLGDSLPSWVVAVAPGLAMLGLLLAAICGLLFVRTLNAYLGHGHESPFVWAVNWSAALVVTLSLIAFFTMRRFYEIEDAALIVLLAGTLQYYLMTRLLLSASGRTTVGAGPQVYLAVTILFACGRNLLAGLVIGGEGP